MASHEQIPTALEGVYDPELGRSVVELDMVRDVTVEGTRRGRDRADRARLPTRASFQEQVEKALMLLDGVDEVELGFDVMTPDEKAALTSRLRGGVSERTPGISADSSTRVLAVASGKGGVGKSSLAANLAARLAARPADRRARRGRLRLLDPAHARRPPAARGGRRRRAGDDRPPVRGDLKVMSIGFFLDENTPVMWRGPMLHRALEQFLSDVHWGELDTLVVDMLPGTGDVAISLGQLLPRAEAVVVSTPHRASQQVAVRAAQMARKTNMRLLGVVENMAYLAREDGPGGALRLRRRRGAGRGGGGAAARQDPLLDPRLGALADKGEPIVLAEPDAVVSRAIVELAEAIAATRREQGVGIVKPLPLVHS